MSCEGFGALRSSEYSSLPRMWTVYKIRPGNIKMCSGYNCHMRGKHLDSVIL